MKFFANSRPSALNFKSFFLIIRTIFSGSRSEQFWLQNTTFFQVRPLNFFCSLSFVCFRLFTPFHVFWTMFSLFFLPTFYLNKHTKERGEIVFCYQNCSDLLWQKIVLVIQKKLLKSEAEGWEFSNFLRSLEQFLQKVKGQTNFWNRMLF